MDRAEDGIHQVRVNQEGTEAKVTRLQTEREGLPALVRSIEWEQLSTSTQMREEPRPRPLGQGAADSRNTAAFDKASCSLLLYPVSEGDKKQGATGFLSNHLGRAREEKS